MDARPVHACRYFAHEEREEGYAPPRPSTSLGVVKKKKEKYISQPSLFKDFAARVSFATVYNGSRDFGHVYILPKSTKRNGENKAELIRYLENRVMSFCDLNGKLNKSTLCTRVYVRVRASYFYLMQRLILFLSKCVLPLSRENIYSDVS